MTASKYKVLGKGEKGKPEGVKRVDCNAVVWCTPGLQGISAERVGRDARSAARRLTRDEHIDTEVKEGRIVFNGIHRNCKEETPGHLRAVSAIAVQAVAEALKFEFRGAEIITGKQQS